MQGTFWKLTCQKFTERPEYEEEFAKYAERQRYAYSDNPQPVRFEQTRMLDVELTEEEFNAVRIAILREMDPKKDAS